MTNPPPVDEEQLPRVFRTLAEHEVEYAVFGGIALGLHGLVRATADINLFVPEDRENIERLKRALRSLYDDPNIDEISAEDLCGAYPAVRYWPPEGFGFDILTRLGEALTYESLEVEKKSYRGITVKVVSAETLWKMKRATVHPVDRMDADALAQRFGFGED